MTCQDEECARIRDDIRAALVLAQAECDLRRRTVTTGGPAVPCDTNRPRVTHPGGPEPEYAALGIRQDGSARTSGTTERTAP